MAPSPPWVDVLSRGADESLLIGAPESGNDVFFATSNPVIASDKDVANDIYDVRMAAASRDAAANPALFPEVC